jgi:hypothetical protein
METKEGFPLVLSDHHVEPASPRTADAWDSALISPKILKASFLGATAAAAVVAAVVVMGNPPALVADATAFLAALSAPRDGAHEEAPLVQSSDAAPASQPTASEAPAGNASAAPLQIADQGQTAIPQAPAGALLGQFQAWAAGRDAQAEGRDAQADVRPMQDAQQPVQKAQQDAEADRVEDARAEVAAVQEHQTVRPVKNLRAEIKVKPIHRPKVRPEQTARIKILRPVRDARAREARAQEARAQEARAPEPPVPQARPTFLQSIGLQD